MDITTRTPASLWIVGVLALLWAMIGLASFVIQLLLPAEALQAMPAEQRAVYEAAPGWLYLFYGITTIGGVLVSAACWVRWRCCCVGAGPRWCSSWHCWGSLCRSAPAMRPRLRGLSAVLLDWR